MTDERRELTEHEAPGLKAALTALIEANTKSRRYLPPLVLDPSAHHLIPRLNFDSMDTAEITVSPEWLALRLPEAQRTASFYPALVNFWKYDEVESHLEEERYGHTRPRALVGTVTGLAAGTAAGLGFNRAVREAASPNKVNIAPLMIDSERLFDNGGNPDAMVGRRGMSRLKFIERSAFGLTGAGFGMIAAQKSSYAAGVEEAKDVAPFEKAHWLGKYIATSMQDASVEDFRTMLTTCYDHISRQDVSDTQAAEMRELKSYASGLSLGPKPISRRGFFDTVFGRNQQNEFGR